jgi:hypothetical protein
MSHLKYHNFLITFFYTLLFFKMKITKYQLKLLKIQLKVEIVLVFEIKILDH